MKQAKFPEGFHWGAATASYQVEGGIENCDWAEAARKGLVPPAGRLANHYDRFREDFDLARELGHNAHRFSIEWARIEPEESKFDEREIQHYREVLLALKERKLTPYVTLWHFTLPLWFSGSGGWLRPDAPEIFARYCQFVVEQLGDLCEHFSTMNEPNVYSGHSYVYGAWPPFKRARVLWYKIGKEDGTSKDNIFPCRHRHLFEYLKVERNLITAHCLAYRAIKAVRPEVKVGIIKHVRVFLVGNKNPFNWLLAKVAQYFQTYRFMNALNNQYDEIGLNFYRISEFGGKRNFLTTDMGWRAAPSFIYHALIMLARYKKPIFVAEAGLADAADDMRAQYITQQVVGIKRAIAEGVDVRGHMYWSLIDNYEWALGTGKRFGLIEIDYDTLERKVRPSAYVYKKICEDNGVLE